MIPCGSALNGRTENAGIWEQYAEGKTSTEKRGTGRKFIIIIIIR